MIFILLKRYFSFIVLLFILASLFFSNFSPSTFLIGWDNLLPELGSGINLKRAIFSVWQEYQGLGLLAGNGHAAELPRQLLLLPLSFLPPNLIRQVYIFSMLGLGPIGTYFLIKNLISYKNRVYNQLIPTIGSLFYLLNLATVQTFYVPFEPFITHFAFLPWLLLTVLNFVAKNNKKSLIFLIIINILAIPQGQVPTIFLVYLFSLVFFLLVLVIETKRMEILKRSIKVILLTLFINAFWLLPFIYFGLNNSHVAFDSKINQMSTETVFLQNKEFGNIWDVMLLKGFWFNNVDPSLQGNFSYMLSPWREHLTTVIAAIGYGFFGVILLGFIYVKRRTPFVIPFSALFLLAVAMLAANTPPFSWIDELLRKLPLFNEVFRFPFTKFSILASLTYSFFFAIGVGQIISFLQKLFVKKISPYILFSFFLILLVVFVYPVFNGNLFYNKEKVVIPKEYFGLFEYLKSQDKNLRIANFPQPWYWGWNFYNWGYGGSGFLWYGIEQPILDRAFDVWNNNNENYYWEISYALYSKNASLFENVLNKYQINLLLLDENVINPTDPKVLFKQEFKELVSKISSIKKVKTFGKITLYKVDLKNQTNNFIFLSNKLPAVNSYTWGGDDKAFSSSGNYISANTNFNFFYPLRSLFSDKFEENQEFKAKTDDNSIEFSKTLPSKVAQISIPAAEQFISAEFFATENADRSLTIKANIKTPEVFIESGGEKKKIWGQAISRDLFIIRNPLFPMILNINGLADFKIESKNFGAIGPVLLLNNADNILTLSYNSSPLSSQLIQNKDIAKLAAGTNILLSSLKENSTLSVRIPKIENESQSVKLIPSKDWISQVKDCESFKKGKIDSYLTQISNKQTLELSSENSTACIQYYLQNLDHNQGYIASIDNLNKKGRPIHFWLLNEDEKLSIIDTYFSQNQNLTLSTFIVPPQERFGKGYSLHFDSTSIGSEQVLNDLGEISIYPIPYDLLTGIVASNADNSLHSKVGKPLKVDHPNQTFYRVWLGETPPETIILSQSFDKGWKAYQVESGKSKVKNWINDTFPFIFGKEIKEHVLVNNWENGWVLNNSQLSSLNSYLVIIFLPQYLEYLGFGILIGTAVWFIVSTRKGTQL